MSLMCREDIANATGWRHIGVNEEPNLNLANTLASRPSSGSLSNHILGNCMQAVLSSEVLGDSHGGRSVEKKGVLCSDS